MEPSIDASSLEDERLANPSAECCRKIRYILVILLNKKGTRVIASPFRIKSSGGRIRTSDLRVMSVISA
jgi:hypothetical protein